MTIDEKISMAQRLQTRSNFFRGLWDISSIIYDEQLPTAAVKFDKEGECMGMVINPTFWSELNEEEQTFLVCHELCHFILKHGKRFKNAMAKSPEESNRVNRGTDVNINETLVRCWGFDRTKFVHPKITGGCWVDTVFVEEDGSPTQGIPFDESSDYYINRIMVDEKEGKGGGGQTFDEHQVMAGDATELGKEADALQKEAKKFFDKLREDAEKNGTYDPLLEEAKNAGVDKGGLYDLGDVKKKEKGKWESIIKHWTKKTLIEADRMMERWDLQDRRFADIIEKNKFILPTEVNLDEENFEKGKIDVLFFLDTSGSTFHLKERFFEAALSLPQKRFNLRLFCFDTKCVETDLKTKKVYGGGGTAFKVVADQVIQLEKEGVRPKSIWVITDGYFEGKTNVANPSIWHFFLTEGHSTTLLPDGCKKYMLSAYE